MGIQGAFRMRTVRISDEVWAKIAERGKFGETEDDVLRRVFKLPPAGAGPELPGPDSTSGFATDRHASLVGFGFFLR